MAYPSVKTRAERDVAASGAEGEFVRGGCLDYAWALIAEGGGRLYVVPSRECDFYGRRVPWHFLVRRGDLYYDAFGTHTRQEVLDAWSDIAGSRVFSLRLANKADALYCERDEERYKRALALIRSRG